MEKQSLLYLFELNIFKLLTHLSPKGLYILNVATYYHHHP